MSQIQQAIIAAVLILISLSAAHGQEKVFGNPKSIVYDISFSKGGSLLAATEGNAVNLFNAETGQVVRRFENGHTGQVLSVDISADSTKIASGGKDGLLVIWEIATGKIISKLQHHQGVITALKFHPQRQLLISAGSDDKVMVYDYGKNDLLFQLDRHTDDVCVIALSPDGNTLASAGGDKKILLWDLLTGNLLTEFAGNTNWVRALSFTTNGKKLLSAGDDRRIRSWNLENPGNGSNIYYKAESSGWILSLDDGCDTCKSETVVYAGMDGKIRIYTPFGNYHYALKIPIHQVLFKPQEGNLLKVAVASRGKGLMLIDAKDMKTN